MIDLRSIGIIKGVTISMTTVYPNQLMALERVGLHGRTISLIQCGGDFAPHALQPGADFYSVMLVKLVGDFSHPARMLMMRIDLTIGEKYRRVLREVGEIL